MDIFDNFCCKPQLGRPAEVRPSKQTDPNLLSQAPAEQREIDREIDKGRSPGIRDISLQISETDDEQKLLDPKDEKLLMITNVASEDWGTIVDCNSSFQRPGRSGIARSQVPNPLIIVPCNLSPREQLAQTIRELEIEDLMELESNSDMEEDILLLYELYTKHYLVPQSSMKLSKTYSTKDLMQLNPSNL
ncbi:hypothetical protein PPACK8108_LOCUS309 [Phakopsora pachyrhizi]|uniref:Uncharacterized protein n=1 Tax=Phakopsora pachyrhizi TaxID=170000 RepID=A0AAV0AEZ6_PHAPC|nr:hypothetical protein PPACK8108_LOCUS309 [Phakopsora pachyrhizi]